MKNSAKFYPYPIWNEGALSFLEEHCPNKKKNKKKISRDMGSAPDPKMIRKIIKEKSGILANK